MTTDSQVNNNGGGENNNQPEKPRDPDRTRDLFGVQLEVGIFFLLFILLSSSRVSWICGFPKRLVSCRTKLILCERIKMSCHGWMEKSRRCLEEKSEISRGTRFLLILKLNFLFILFFKSLQESAGGSDIVFVIYFRWRICCWKANGGNLAFFNASSAVLWIVRPDPSKPRNASNMSSSLPSRNKINLISC